jgi:hypothetical protein
MNYNIGLNPEFKEKEKLFNVLINDEVLNTFNPIGIMSMDISKVPFFLKNALKERDYDIIDYSRISFGEYEFDNEILVPEGMVSFSIFDDRTLLFKKEFYILCLELATKSLEAVEKFNLKQKNEVDNNFIEEIKNIIPQLEEKIKVV